MVERLRAGQPLTPREQATHETGLATVVLSLHQQFDAAPAAASTAAQPWPAALAQQMLAVRGLVQQAAGAALTPAQVAARFRRTKAEQVRPLLDTLALMALVRFVEEEGAYAS